MIRLNNEEFNKLAFGETLPPTIVATKKSQIPIKNIKSTNPKLLKQTIIKPKKRMDLSGRRLKLRKTRSLRDIANMFG